MINRGPLLFSLRLSVYCWLGLPYINDFLIDHTVQLQLIGCSTSFNIVLHIVFSHHSITIYMMIIHAIMMIRCMIIQYDDTIIIYNHMIKTQIIWFKLIVIPAVAVLRQFIDWIWYYNINSCVCKHYLRWLNSQYTYLKRWMVDLCL